MPNEKRDFDKEYMQWSVAWVIGVGVILLLTWLLKGDVYALIGFPVIWTFVIGICILSIDDDERKADNREKEVDIQTEAILKANKIMEEQKKKEEVEQGKLK